MKKIIITTLIAIYCSVALGQTKATHFSGTNSSINLGSTIGNGLRTIECWFRPSVNISNTITDPAYSLVVRNDGEAKEFGLYIIGQDWTPNRGKLAFYVRYNNTINEIHSNLDSWSANTWYHVSGTIDPTNGMTLYIDGVAQTETNPSLITATENDTHVTKIGTWGDANQRYFKGDIDEVRFWNRALTGSEVNAKKCCVLNPTYETGLVGYWHMEEGTGTLTNEAINNTNNALTTGVTWVTSNNCVTGTTWYLDQDHDFYASQATTSCGSPGTGWTTTSMPVIDCNDQNAAINPGMLENYNNSIDDNCDAIIQYQLSASSNSGGSISPSGNMIVTQGANQYYTITPQAGYFIQDIFVDGVSVGTNSPYGFTNIHASHTIVVNFAQIVPSITIASNDNDNTICSGTSITFNATATNGGVNPVYQWKKNGVTVGSNQPTYTPAFINNNDIITCILNPGANQIISNAIQVTVNALPSTNLILGGNTLCANTPLNPNMFYLQTQNQNDTYQWFNNGVAIPGETGAGLPAGIGSNVSALGAYQLSVVVTNAITGCSAESPAQPLTINPAPTVSISGQTLICAGSSALLTANGSSDVSSYQWSGPGVNGSTSQSVNVTNYSVYNVQVLNTFGCMAMVSHNVTVLPAGTAVIDPQGPTTFCQGGSVTLSAHDQSYSAASTYLWSNGATTQNITVNTAGTYDVTVTNPNGCSAETQITVNVNALPNISITSSNGTTICNGVSTTLSANGGASYVWDTGSTNQSIAVTPQTNTTYNVIGTDANGCVGTANIQIAVNALPNIAITSSNGNSICNGGSTTLSVNGASSYLWSTGAVTSNILVSPQSTTNYNVTGTNANGCVATANIQITVNALPNITITSSNGTNICSGSNTTLTGNGGVSYVWGNGATTQNITVAPQNNTTYVLTGTDANGCSNNTSLAIQTASNCAVINNNFCSKTITNLAGTLISAQAWVPNATNYQFVFTPTNGGSPVVYNTPNAYVYLQYVTALQYSTSYSVSLQATVNGVLTPVNTSTCTLNIGLPTAVMNSNFCSTTVTNLAGTLISAQVWVTNVTNYQFVFTPTNGGTPVVFNTPNAYVYLQYVTALQYNTTYNVSVQASVGNLQGPVSTATCPLNIGAPTAVMNSNFCNTTVTNLAGTLISAQAWVTNVTNYQFVFTPTNGGTPIVYNTPNAYVYLQYVTALQYNTSYNVSVQASTPNATGPISTATCPLNIGAPTAIMNSNFCNKVITNLSGTLISAQAWVTNVTNYQFVFTPTNGGTPIVYNTANAYVYLQYVTGLQYNTTYNVSVQASTPSATGPVNTATCVLTIGNHAGSRMESITEEEIETLPISVSVYPNPANKEVTVQLPENAQAHISIMDAQGKLVKEESTQDQTTKIDLENLSEGIYFIHIIQNGKTYKEKIIKN